MLPLTLDGNVNKFQFLTKVKFTLVQDRPIRILKLHKLTTIQKTVPSPYPNVNCGHQEYRSGVLNYSAGSSFTKLLYTRSEVPQKHTVSVAI